MSAPPCLVSTEWLAAQLGADDLRVVDATYCLPAQNRDPHAEYRAAHLPGAVFFDIDDVADPASPLPHMLPTAELFARKAGALGLGDRHRIVVYDGNRFSASARVWWMLRLFGHSACAVLDGGIAKWRAEGRPLDAGTVAPTGASFAATFDANAVRDLEGMRAHVAAGDAQVVDVRAAGRFAGTAPEPRPHLRSGHIPGSVNLPYTELLAADDTMLPPERLREVIAAAGVDPRRPVVTTCGSGVTACILNLALARLDRPKTAFYDGSWSEWGGRDDTPVAP